MLFSLFALVLFIVARAYGACEPSMDDCCPQQGIVFSDCAQHTGSANTPTHSGGAGGGLQNTVACCVENTYDPSKHEKNFYRGCPFVIEFKDVVIPAGTTLKVRSLHCKNGCKVASISSSALPNFHLRVNSGSFVFTYDGQNAPSFKWTVVGPGCSCAGGCTPGWTLFNGVCYHVQQCPDNWDNQKKHCESLGATMIPIKDQATMDFINAFGGKHTFIGMRSYDGGLTWTFLDGTKMQLNLWDVGHPVLYLVRHCTETSASTQGLSTVHCDSHAKAICCKNPSP